VLGALAALVGWGPIAENLARIGPLYFLVLGRALRRGADRVHAGLVVHRRRPHPMSFGELLAAYLAGDSVNYFTSVGGEPVKAHILDSKMGFRPAFATIWVHRNADVLSQWMFLVVGAVVTMTHFELPERRALARHLRSARARRARHRLHGLQRKGFFGAFFRIFMKVPVLAKKIRTRGARARRRREDPPVLPPRGAQDAVRLGGRLGVHRLVRRAVRDLDRAPADVADARLRVRLRGRGARDDPQQHPPLHPGEDRQRGGHPRRGSRPSSASRPRRAPRTPSCAARGDRLADPRLRDPAQAPPRRRRAPEAAGAAREERAP
jgi:hypothetical protein